MLDIAFFLPLAFNLRPLSLILSLYFPNDSCRIAGDDAIIRHIFDDDAAGADDGTFTDGDAAQNGGIGADGSAFFGHRGYNLPVILGLKSAGFGGGTREFVVDKHHAVADEDLIGDGDAFADERVALDLAVFADKGIFLYLDKGADPGTVADPAAVKIDEFV